MYPGNVGQRDGTVVFCMSHNYIIKLLDTCKGLEV